MKQFNIQVCNVHRIIFCEGFILVTLGWWIYILHPRMESVFNRPNRMFLKG